MWLSLYSSYFVYLSFFVLYCFLLFLFIFSNLFIFILLHCHTPHFLNPLHFNSHQVTELAGLISRIFPAFCVFIPRPVKVLDRVTNGVFKLPVNRQLFCPRDEKKTQRNKKLKRKVIEVPRCLVHHLATCH